MKKTYVRLLSLILTLCICMSFAAIPAGAVEPEGMIDDTNPAVITDDGAGSAWGRWEDELRFQPVLPQIPEGQEGASITVYFTGTGLTMIGQKAVNGPIMSVTVDDQKVHDVDFYHTSTTDIYQKVWEITGLKQGNHVARFVYDERVHEGAYPLAYHYQAAFNYFLAIDGGPGDPSQIPQGPERVVYDNEAPDWALAPEAGNTVLDPESPLGLYGLYTWNLTTSSQGSFGAAFYAGEAGFSAVYAQDGKLLFRDADGTETEIASVTLEPETPCRVQVLSNADSCSIFLDGVEMGSVPAAGAGTQAGAMGLYNPGRGAGTLTSNHFYELFCYTNDFGDAANLGKWTAGNATRTEDGKLLLDMRAVSNAILRDSPVIEDGIYEFDFSNDQPAEGRVGFLFRTTQDYFQGLFYDVGKWVWFNGPDYGGISASILTDEAREYHLKITVVGQNVSLEIDGETAFAGAISQLELGKAGRFAIRKQWNNAKITLDNLKISEVVPIHPDAAEADPVTVGSGLKVTMDRNFPHVLSYELDGKTLPGSFSGLSGLILNGKSYYPLVSTEKTDENTLVYTMKVPTLGLGLKMTYTVENNILQMRLTEVTEEGGFRLTSLGFTDPTLVSTQPGDASASYGAVNTTGGWFGSTDVIYNTLRNVQEGSFGRGYAMLASNGLAATVNNSVLDASTRLATGAEVTEAGTRISVGNGTLTYRTPLDQQEGTHHDVWSSVAICGDYNGNGSVDWQDAAANYRNIRTEILGVDTMKDNMMYIAMNFASQAQTPFHRSLDLGKTISNYTDGFGQMIMHKGFAAEGHDDCHADYGGHVGVRQGGAEDFNYVIREGAKYNIKYGIHINVSEHHPEAFHFNPDVMSRPLAANWGWLDQAYWVNEYKDVMSGNRKTNLDLLEETLPDLSFVYVDIYGSSNWLTEDLVKNLNSHGLIAGTEFGGAMEMGAAFTHWGRDRSYPNHGNNSRILRFVKNDLDIFVTNDLFNSSVMPRVATWSNMNVVHEAVTDFYNHVLPAKYLQHFGVMEMGENYVNFTDGVRTERKNGVVEMTRNGKLLATWTSIRQNPADNTWADSDTGEATLFIPWYGADSAAKDPNEAGKIYYWNPAGTETTWDVPETWTGSANLYRLDRDSKALVRTVEIADGKVTLHEEAGLGYVLYPNETKPVVIDNFGEGSGIRNSGFEDRTLKGWETEGTAEAEVICTERNWEPRLAVSGEGEKVLTQTLTDLKPGKDHILYFFADIGEAGKVKASVTTGSGTYTAETASYTLPHNDQSKYWGEYFQKVRLVFSVPENETTAELQVTGIPNGGTVYLDDFTLFEALTEEVAQAGKGSWSNYLFIEDFENVEQGLGAFTYNFRSNGHTHLAERSETEQQFTDYVIGGHYSMKSNEFDFTGTAFRTRPELISLDANREYEVGFAYETGLEGAHRVSLRKADGTEVWGRTLSATELNGQHGQVHETFTSREAGEYYFTLDYLKSIRNEPLGQGIQMPEGSNMEYIYVSLDDLYIRLTAADADKAAAQAVEDQIAAIGEVNLDSEKAITAARQAYDGLTEAQKELVQNLETLKAAEAKLRELKDEAAAQAEALRAAKAAAKEELDKVDCTGRHEAECDTIRDEYKEAIEEAGTPEEVQRLLAAAGEKLAQAAICPSEDFKDVKANGWYHEAVDYAIENGLMKGVSKDKFSIDGTLTRGQLVTILYRAEGSPSVEGMENPFGDIAVAPQNWYAQAVIWAYNNGIVKGVTDVKFAPMSKITREQLVSILYRYDGSNAVEGNLKEFADAGKVSVYAKQAMVWGVENGIVSGIPAGGKLLLKPQGNATRAQAAAIMMRFLENMPA